MKIFKSHIKMLAIIAAFMLIPLPWGIVTAENSQTAVLELLSDNINENNVDLYPLFKLTFSENISESSAGGIVLYEEEINGAVIATTIKASGAVAEISPNAALKPKTKYILVLPNTLKSEIGSSFAGRNIVFYTENSIDVIGAADFNSLPENANVWNIISYLADKGLTMEYMPGNLTGWIDNEAHYIQYKIWMTDKNKLEIKDGALHILGDYTQKGFAVMRLWPTANSRMSAKKLKFDFDIKFGAYSGGSGYLKPFIVFTKNQYGLASGVAARFDHESGYFLYEDYNGGQWSHGDLINVYTKPTDWVHYSLLLDFDSHTMKVTQNGTITETVNMDPNQEYFREIYTLITSEGGIQSNEFWLDNISISEALTPMASVSSGSSVDKIEVEFNTVMSEGSVAIKKADGGIIDSDGYWKSDGCTYTILPDESLDYGTSYTVAITNMISADGVTLETVELPFTTKSIDIECEITDTNGKPIEMIEAGKTIRARAIFKDFDGSAGDLVLVTALYDKADNLLEIAGGAGNFDGTPQKTTATEFIFATDSALEPGAYLKIFAWDAKSVAKPVLKEIIFGK